MTTPNEPRCDGSGQIVLPLDTASRQPCPVCGRPVAVIPDDAGRRVIVDHASHSAEALPMSLSLF